MKTTDRTVKPSKKSKMKIPTYFHHKNHYIYKNLQNWLTMVLTVLGELSMLVIAYVLLNKCRLLFSNNFYKSIQIVWKYIA